MNMTMEELNKLDYRNHMRSLLYIFHFLNVDVPIMFLAEAHTVILIRGYVMSVIKSTC